MTSDSSACRRSGRRFLAVAVLLAVSSVGIDVVLSATRPAVRAEHGMVVSADALATGVGVQVLRDGGNAVDAAVAVAFALAVTFPEAGNLGGGGFLLYRSPGGEHFALDFRETAPRALRAKDFVDEQGDPVPGLSERGGLAVGVPGTVAGLAEAHRKWGSLPWGSLLAPAISIAEDGFPVSRRTAGSLSRFEAELAAEPSTRAIFFRDGRLLSKGERLARPALAATLQRIAAEGSAGFYEGPVADAVIRTVRRAGGVMEPDDLTAYRPVFRRPLERTYRGHRVVTFPPPGGGVVLLQILGMLERYDPADSGYASSMTIHRTAEAMRRAYADRSRWLGDPESFDNRVEALLDPDYLASRAGSIRKRKATPSRKVRPSDSLPLRPTETTHLSVADREGGAVALTTTLNYYFGAFLVAEGTGVLLNNEIDDFSLAPGAPNLYGLVGGEANAVRPGKRPLSSMTPTIVEPRGGGARPLLVLGSPGGSKITTAVLQVLVNVIDHRMPLQEAVDAPRFHHQWLPDRIDHEPRTLPADVARALEARGHRLAERKAIGNVNTIGIDADGAWLGAADPRRGGLAEGYASE
jgi:gamma-glutamyltranspeptidase/glutathione hydrolase